jgi:hypothetical protein
MSNDRSPHNSAIGPGLPPVPIRVLELEAERDRLRAALEKIWNAPSHVDAVGLRNWAGWALVGADPDEEYGQ